MNDMALARIRYGTPANYSFQAQNYADIDSYLIPLGQARDSALHSWGVANGLRVTATAERTGVKVSTGSALDAAGHVIVLSDGGLAVVDQQVADGQHTVQVAADELTLETDGLTLPGDQVLTLTWLEVEGTFQVLGTVQKGLLLAPWLRLLPLSAFQDTGQQVVLAQLTFGSGGQVNTLSPGPRRAVGVPVERLEFRRPLGSNNPTLNVGDVPAADLRARADGGLDVNVPSADGTGRRALSVEGGTGKLKVQAGLQIDGGSWDDDGLRLTSSSSGSGSGLQLENAASGARTYGMYSGSDGRWHFVDGDADRDRLLIDATGNVAIGSSSPKRALHVEGTEVHSGGTQGGFSFADRTATSGSFTETPNAGQRWVWYAENGKARLWSGTDQITIGTGNNGDALDVSRRMRVRQGPDSSAGIWFRQASANTDSAFVGMASDTLVGFHGTSIVGWGLVMDTASGNVRLGKALSLSPKRALHVEGTEVHSGGTQGGFSFADRTATSGSFTETPNAGQRWVWYAENGKARLWSGTDQITIGTGNNGDALDVSRRMRVRQGPDSSAGIWFRQKSANTDSAFVGMAGDTLVGFWGTSSVGWGLVMDTLSGKVGIGIGTATPNGRLDVRVGQGETAVAATGKLDVEGYQGYAAVDVRGTVKIAAKGGYEPLKIEQQPAYTAAYIHGKLHVKGYDGYSAIYAEGNVRVIGTVTGSAQRVTIDHPADPANKYLSHTTVQSPEMTTFYDGTIVTDDQGEATVELPGYFEALNGARRYDSDFRYQLTPVGCLAVAVVVGEIEHNRFTIRTDKPGVKVSWQVTGTRRDTWANAHRIEAEVDKPEAEREAYRSAGSSAPGGDGLLQAPVRDAPERGL
ncbi:hypothetical protein OHB05_00965 [Streptomyces sp. NBC_00638]|uniref:hypothetical protein n=1 Tax=unclassified Streptomyces TaxID=2593676 RepID=UPI002250C738|nr:hypothetical protein [Streptomyces sp. NBC_00638]MCX5001200.1 hypothetical protein [Streptomyces sp. NBC_00638]